MGKELSKTNLFLMLLSIISIIIMILTFILYEYFWIFKYFIMEGILFFAIPILIIVYFAFYHVMEYFGKTNLYKFKPLNFLLSMVYFIIIFLRYLFFPIRAFILEFINFLIVIAIGVINLILYNKNKAPRVKRVKRKEALIKLQELKMLYDKEILTETEYNERRRKYIDYI